MSQPHPPASRTPVMDVPTTEREAAPTEDPRSLAFCRADGPEIFHSVSHRHEIWRQDPYDVETIHQAARTTFQRLLNRATTPPGFPSGRILLLQGESGSGKTHLMRAFRNFVHGHRLGYCGYMQMTALTNNYGRYVLSNLIDSLDQPYFEADGDTSGLMRLANAIAETPHSILPTELTTLREGEFDDQRLASFIHELADLVVAEEGFAKIDLDLIRALLYLQRNEPRLKSRVLRYLRCEDLADNDRKVLGGMVPRKNEEDPQKVVELLGQLMGQVQSVSLVLCIDQLEDIFNLEEAEVRFRRAMATVSAIADHVPSSILVISCLEDYYTKLRGSLGRQFVDRIEKDPEPIRLDSQRGEDEIRQLIQQRLVHLYESLEVPYREEEPTFPFPLAELQKLTNLRTRDVLDWCREYRNRCVTAGSLIDFPSTEESRNLKAEETEETLTLEQAWNDFQMGWKSPPPEKDTDLSTLLAWAIKTCSEEVSTGHSFEADACGRLIDVELHGEDSADLLVVGVCNKAPAAGALGRQIKEVEDRAGEHVPVIVRSTDYPSSPRSLIAKQIGQLITRGGRRVVVEDSDWRSMLAYQDFRRKHDKEPEFKTWLRGDKPLSRLKSLREILALDHLKPLQRETAGTQPERPSFTPPKSREAKPFVLVGDPEPAHPTAGTTGPIVVGVTTGRAPAPVTVTPAEFNRHAAFLGGTGSGKTTVALNILEQLLLRGTPVVLVDRKGDLCGYTRPETWAKPAPNEDLATRRERLREQVDVAVFTPGNPNGRPLAISIVPDGMEQMPPFERDQVAGYAAFALGGMMGYRDKGQEASRLAILRQAIHLLGTLDPREEVTLDGLIRFIHEPDPALVAAIGQLDTKLFKRLVQDLQTLRLNKGELLSGRGERLNTESLLGVGGQGRAGKTRLSIISTKFLGDNANIEFWVAQLLMEVTRWASKHPSADLQAVFLFDEADMYLPAQRKPATKEPMENLLKRARSAGIGLFLASQSPGDFDYKCRDNIRTWFLGRITQQTALAKMKPMLSDCRIDVEAKLPVQQTGQFHLVREGDVTSLQANRSFMATEQLAEEQILEAARLSRP